MTRVCAVDTMSPVKSGMVLVDRGNEDLAIDGEIVLSVPADNSWIVLQTWEDAVFIDEHGKIRFNAIIVS